MNNRVRFLNYAGRATRGRATLPACLPDCLLLAWTEAKRRQGMSTNLHLPRAQRLIWLGLDSHPGVRPRVADMSRMVGVGELELRRSLRRNHAAPCRAMITYGCLTYAARLIADGMKVEAAMSLAGFRNKTVFCRNCRDYLGFQPHALRGRSIDPLIDWDGIESSIRM